MRGARFRSLVAGTLLSFLANGTAIAAAPDELSFLVSDSNLPNAIWVDSLDLSGATQDWGAPLARRSVENHPITLHGTVYPHGIGTHARSEFLISLKRSARSFVSMVGIDDEAGKGGSARFQVFVDGRLEADSGVMRGGDPTRLVRADLRGGKVLRLVVEDGGDGIAFDNADWAGAAILLISNAKSRPSAFELPPSPMPRLAFGDPPQPAIHGARVVGSTPGRPFLFRVPATGKPPLTYRAENLPAGLRIDGGTGIISGSLEKDGETVVTLTVSGPRGSSSRRLRIVGGKNRLALTPTLGWNSWNVWAREIDDPKVRAAADALVTSGLAAHGFSYVNIDDCWQGSRDAQGEIQPGPKFPNMKALADYVHGKGLRFGIYSSPGPMTCTRHEGSYGHERQDAETFARWGVDSLKYDWCSYDDVAQGTGAERQQRPYRVMREALDRVNRDILFGICQYGVNDVWRWGAEVGGNSWRTSHDLNDSWGSLSGIAFQQDGREKFAGPGHWNDPDMLVVGELGWGPKLHPSRLTPDEQVTHLSMWCLLASPLLVGCDITRLDRFTLSLLTNDEALDVDQDPLGQAASRKSQAGTSEVWARPLWDGTLAVGLVNRGIEAAEITASWDVLGIAGAQPVRDIWRRKTLGIFERGFKARVPAHGTVFVKVGRPRVESDS